MTTEQINQGINLLCDTSKKVQQYYEDDQAIVTALNQVPKEELKQCLDYYKNRKGVIVDLRKELIQNLYNNKTYTVEDLYNLIEKHKQGKENKFQAYTKLFSMFYPPITFYGHNPEREFVSQFTDQLITDLSLTDVVNVTKYDFQGPRQQGSDRFWVAIYNKAQDNQSSSLQIFIEFHQGKVNYGIYKHSEKKYIKPRQQVEANEFSYEDLLNYFATEKQLIINDVPDYSNATKIHLNGSRLYKMSHGSFKAKKYRPIIEAFKENNWICIYKTTGKGQAEHFKNELKKGDFVYITLGSNELIGIAKITSNDYGYVPEDIVDDDGWLYREIELIKPPVKKNPKALKDTRSHFPSGNTTLAEIKTNDLEEANTIFFKPYFNTEFVMSDSPTIEKDVIKYPLNQILYGPPGTGKTYHTVLEAARIVTNNKDITYEDALQVFNNQLGKQIAFITFHQNYSYEDFIQGLRPDTETNGDLSFYKKDGVFKVIADKALNNIKAAKHPEAAKLDFETVFNRLIQPLKDEDQDELEIPMKRASFFITEVGEKSIEFRKNQGDSKHTLSISTLKKMYDKEENDIILGGLQPYYNPILQLLLEQGKRQVEQVPLKNYVIIIDEINRANISRVFGELITLIEKDKRSHGNIPLSVTLPSGDVFTVPSNLYIIGTMNTADKSIALLDIALRRRFEFVPMYPKYQIEGKTIHKSEFLRQLNDLIVKSGKGQDFTIGHAYFMCDDHDTFDFETTLNNKVIPLLLEYFMNDVEEVTKLLNQAGVTVGDWPLRVLPND